MGLARIGQDRAIVPERRRPRTLDLGHPLQPLMGYLTERRPALATRGLLTCGSLDAIDVLSNQLGHVHDRGLLGEMPRLGSAPARLPGVPVGSIQAGPIRRMRCLPAVRHFAS